MQPIYLLIIELIQLFKYALIIYIIGMWLTQFNIVNGGNRFVYIIMDFLYKLCEPSMKIVRNFLPNFGVIDISPIILLLGLWFTKLCMQLYLRPAIF